MVLANLCRSPPAQLSRLSCCDAHRFSHALGHLALQGGAPSGCLDRCAELGRATQRSHAERNPLQQSHSAEEVEAIAAHLKRSLEDVVVAIFTAAKGAAAAAAGDTAPADEPLKVRWVEAYFPFTSPSWELEVFWQGDWLEVLGSGIVQQSILNNAGVSNKVGWAFVKPIFSFRTQSLRTAAGLPPWDPVVV